MNDYLKKRQEHIFTGRPPKEKKVYKLNKISPQKAEQNKQLALSKGDGDGEKDRWFSARRKELTGTCQCGCARKSSKHEDDFFRSSCCHIFPQRLFASIQLHPLNCVERNFWDGCHTNMDNKSMDLWPKFADWDDIKERFYMLAPLLTDEERAKKFYKHLEKLIYGENNNVDKGA